jgi:WD40 repeat protein
MSEREERVGEAVAWYFQQVEAGTPPTREALLARFPDLCCELESFLADKGAFDRAAGPAAPQPELTATIPPAPRSTADTATVPPAPCSPTDPSATVACSAAASALDRVRYFGDYELLAELARGGMGVVFRARQVSLNREVALKMILSGQLASPEDVIRFRAEAEAAANLDHPNILPIYEIGDHQGQQYFSMKLATGGSLAGRVSALGTEPMAVVGVLLKVCRAVDFAHRHGILHRDLKPGNVLLDADGTPFVTDFGLAKKVEGDSNLTQSGAIVGTPSYMAPEQARAEKQLTTAADIYALGAILYELLTGQPPFRGPAVLDTILQVIEKEPAEPRSINPRAPRDLSVVALKCLAKDPGKRYESAAAMADDLERWVRGEPIVARPVGPRERAVKWVKRNPVVAGLLLVVVVSVLGGVTGILMKYRDAKEQEGIARHKAQETEDALRDRDVALQQARDESAATSRQLAISNVLLAQGAWASNNPAVARAHLAAVPPDLRRWEWYYLNRQYQGGIFTLTGHAAAVTGVAFSPDGTWLATASEDNTAQLWDARTGHFIHAFKGHTGGVTGLAFSTDGTRLTTASEDNTARLWEARTGHLIREFKGHHSAVTGVAFSPDGTRLATASGDCTVRVWDTGTGQQLLECPDSATIGVMGVAFSPDGTRLATATGFAGKVRLWDARMGRKLLECETPCQVWGVAFSPDGTRLVTANQDAVARVYDAGTGRQLLECRGHTDIIWGVAFSPDGARLATASADQTARVWDAHTGHQFLECRGHAGHVKTVAFSPDGVRLATASYDRTARLWDARTGQPVVECTGHTGYAMSVAFGPGGLRLATASYDRTARLWDARTGRQLLECTGHTDFVLGVAFNPDGTRLATAGRDKTARLWEIPSRFAKGTSSARLEGFARTGRQLREFKGHTKAVNSVAFSPDGMRLATASEDTTARIWDAHTGEQLAELRGHTAGVRHVAFSPDGARLATAGEDMTARIWDARTGESLRECKGHSHWVLSVAFSSDGTRLATASADQTARLWATRTGAVLRELKGHGTGQVASVAFSPDGTRLATGGSDRTLRLWDVETGQALLVCRNPSANIESLAFSPDGTRLATATSDTNGATRVWDARPVPATWDEEQEDRRRATRPDPDWHVTRQRELTAEGNSYGAALHRSFEHHARGVLALDDGDLDRAWWHFIVAVALKPAPPPAPQITPLPARIPLAK